MNFWPQIKGRALPGGAGLCRVPDDRGRTFEEGFSAPDNTHRATDNTHRATDDTFGVTDDTFRVTDDTLPVTDDTLPVTDDTVRQGFSNSTRRPHSLDLHSGCDEPLILIPLYGECDVPRRPGQFACGAVEPDGAHFVSVTPQ
jgi:hypothetical protein